MAGVWFKQYEMDVAHKYARRALSWTLTNERWRAFEEYNGGLFF